MDLEVQAKELLAKLNQEQEEKIKIALFGQPGAGKSSLINQMVGANVAETSVRTDTTKLAQIVEHKEVVFVDLPGYDTSGFPTNSYFTQFNPLQYDLFICVFSGKLHQSDVNFFRLVKAQGTPCVFVRNKSDGIYDDNMTLEESQQVIARDVAGLLGEEVPVVFTSCRNDLSIEEKGIHKLEMAIMNSLDSARQGRFVRTAKAYTQELLEQKRKECRKFINNAMLKGAVNGLNPIVGVDITIDMEIMNTMFTRVRECFGVQIEEVQANKVRGQITELILKGAKQQTIVNGLETLMKDRIEKKLAKYIPYIGQITAMSLGAGSMYYMGYEYVDACYEYARQRLQEEIARSV